VGYEPLEGNVDIVLLLAGDGVAADLSVLQIINLKGVRRSSMRGEA